MSERLSIEHGSHPAQPSIEQARTDQSDLLHAACFYGFSVDPSQITPSVLCEAAGLDRTIVLEIFPTQERLNAAVWLHDMQISQSLQGKIKICADDLFPSGKPEEALLTSSAAVELSMDIHGSGYRTCEMSVEDFINDPLVALLNRADGVSWRSYAQLLESAARVALRKKHST